jgi:hypothetical protein
MDTNQLTTTAGSGVQATTQSPQSAGQPSTAGAQSSSVQPGTATALLNGQSGVPLHGTVLSTINLNATTPAIVSVPTSNQPKHHVNLMLFGLSALLLVVAVVLFWTTTRSAKNTT